MQFWWQRRYLMAEGEGGGEGAGGEGGAGTGVADPGPGSPGADGSGDTPPIAGMDWRVTLPHDLQGSPTVQNYKDQNAFVKDALEWNSEIGRRARVPQQPDNAEAWQQYARGNNPEHSTLPGYPEAPEGYRETAVPELPDGMQFDDELLSGALAVAHKWGYSPHQLKPMLEFYSQYVMQQNNKADAAAMNEQRDWESETQAKFGGSTNQILNNNRAFVTMSTPDQQLNAEALDILNETGVGSHPRIVEWIYKMSLQTKDSMQFVSEGFGNTIPTSDDFAKQRADLAASAADSNDEFMKLVKLNQIERGVAQAPRRY